MSQSCRSTKAYIRPVPLKPSWGLCNGSARPLDITKGNPHSQEVTLTQHRQHELIFILINVLCLLLLWELDSPKDWKILSLEPVTTPFLPLSGFQGTENEAFSLFIEKEEMAPCYQKEQYFHFLLS